MEDVLQRILVEAVLQVDKVKAGLRDIFSLLDVRDAKEKAKDAEQVASQTKQLRQTQELGKAQALVDQKEIDALKQKILAQERLNRLKQEALKQLGRPPEEPPPPKTPPERGGTGGVFRSFLPGIASAAGGGFVGDVVAAFAGTTAAFAGVELLTHGITHLTAEVRHFIEVSGPLEQVENAFARLTERAGGNAEDFASKLNKASLYLVDDMQLLQGVNKILAQSPKISTEGVEEYVQAVTELARVQGKSVPEAFAMSNTALLRGRAMYLQMQGMIKQVTVQELMRTRQMAASQQVQERMNILTAAFNKMIAEAGGAPALNYSERLRQLSKVTEDFFERLASAVTKSQGFQSVMVLLDKVIKLVADDGESFGKVIGESVGETLGLITPVISNAVDLLTLLFNIFVELVTIVRELNTPLTDLLDTLGGTEGNKLDNASVRIFTLKGLFVTLAQTISIVNEGIERLIARVQFLTNLPSKGIAQSVNDLEKALDEAERKGTERLVHLEDILTGQAKRPATVAKPSGITPPDEEDKKIAAEVEKVKNDIAQEGAKQRLNIEKERIEKEKELLNQETKNYEAQFAATKRGLDERRRINDENLEFEKVTQREHLRTAIEILDAQENAEKDHQRKLEEIKNRQIDLENELIRAEITRANEEAAIKQKELKATSEEKGTAPEVETVQSKLIEAQRKTAVDELTGKIRLNNQKRVADEVETQSKIEQINEDTAIKRLDLYKRVIDEETKASRAAAEADARMRIKSRQDAEDEIARRFKTGRTITGGGPAASSIEQAKREAEAYIQLQEQKFQREYQEAVSAAARDFALNRQSADAQKKLEEALFNAKRDFANKTTQLHEDEVSTILDSEEKRYNFERDLAEAQIANEAGSTQKRQDLIRQQIKNAEDLLTHQQEALSRLDIGSDQWLKLQADIEKTIEDIQRYKQELETTPRATGKLVGVFSDLFGQFTTGGAISDALRTQQRGIESSAAYRTGVGRIFAPGTAAAQEPIIGFGKALKDLIKPTQDLNGVVPDLAVRLSNLSSVAQTVFDSISSAVRAFTSAQSGISGAIGGGLAAGGLANQIGGALSKSTSAVLKSIGGFLGGPFGMAITTGIGAIFGGILGHARAEMEKAAKKMQEAFDKVSKSISDGDTQLKDGIIQLQQLRAQTIQELSGKKGGRDKLKEILPQMDEQIKQLQKRQEDLITNLNLDLEKLNAPESYAGAIDSVNAIIKKYQEYLGAVNDVAKAQEFLNLSVQRYIDQQQKDLTAGEKDAIDNALKYNDLLQQRQDILDQTAQTEYEIRTRGVLTRELTGAQQKMQEIADVEKQKQDQLTQIDKQIELAKYQMDAQKTIYNLASDRVSLEARLLTLQKQAIDADVQRIAQLRQVISMIQGGGFGLSSLLPATLTGNNLAVTTEDYYALQGRMGYNGFYGE